MFAPLLRIFTAKLWRAQCQLMCLLIPARFTHRFTDLQQLSYEGRLNMEEFKSSGASPINDNRPSFRGITTPLLAECPLAYFAQISAGDWYNLHSYRLDLSHRRNANRNTNKG